LQKNLRKVTVGSKLEFMPIPLKPNPTVAASITTAVEPLYCDKRQLAHAFGVSLRTVANWQSKGVIPYIKIGGAVRFDLAQCREVVKKRLTHHERQQSDDDDGRWSEKQPRKNAPLDRAKDVFRKDPKINPMDAAIRAKVHLTTAYRARQLLIASGEMKSPPPRGSDLRQ
jgi:hypothetical protein